MLDYEEGIIMRLENRKNKESRLSNYFVSHTSF